MFDQIEDVKQYGKLLYREFAEYRVKMKPATSGPWEIQQFETETNMSYLRMARDGRDPGIGKFTRLVFAGHTTVMSDTVAEVRDLIPYLRHLRGDVLVTGLGLGMTLNALTKIEKYSQHVKSILVVEKSADVINLSAKYYRDKRIRIINEDAYSFRPEIKFDAAWHDVWNDISSDNDFTRMRRHWSNFMRAPSSQYCWGEREAKALDRRYGYG